jgi:hypothetical protein
VASPEIEPKLSLQGKDVNIRQLDKEIQFRIKHQMHDKSLLNCGWKMGLPIRSIDYQKTKKMKAFILYGT